MTRPHAFLFGKLPRHGDFVARGLDADSREAWDRWASRGLEAAHAALGEGFESAHDTAPPWRFVEGGRNWRVGAMTPSVDSVGRRFVVVLGAEGLSTGQAAAEVLAERFETVIHRGFMEGLTADELVRAGEDLLDNLPEVASTPVARWWTEGGPDHPPQTLAAGTPPEDLFVRMLRPETMEPVR